MADSTTVTVSNANPSVSISTPVDMSIASVNTAVRVTAPYSDAGANDAHTCSVDWGDAVITPAPVAAGSCSATHNYTAIGVYTVTVTIRDDDGGSGSASIAVVIADAATKITGGGYVVGPRYSFGFVAKQATDGSLRGQIQVRAPGNQVFHGDAVTSLSVTGNTGSWSGTGAWGHIPGYRFTATVADGGTGRSASADTIRVTITAPNGAVVASFSGPLKGGNVVVHR